ncbi:unnamed protein product [Moneuplotes crassus]|uniref:AP2/ERF domain-containing protein n=1 Tax=Euplotes crassus TaxID=5936 RepID=A0AAD1UFZ2_EUPCR|nr:unnamed protein product [Moneuplotes crassus]
MLFSQGSDLSIQRGELAFVKPIELPPLGDTLITELARSYCLCNFDLKCFCHCETPSPLSPCSDEIKTWLDINLQEYPKFQNETEVDDTGRAPSEGDRTNHLQSRLIRLYQYLVRIEDPFKTLVFGRPKSNRRTSKISTRRSRYTGVFKNGSRWQALINVGNKKTYIHTYSTQEEAARAFDLMSLLLNRMKAVTNYSYSKEDIFSLFSEYSDIVNKFCS